MSTAVRGPMVELHWVSPTRMSQSRDWYEDAVVCTANNTEGNTDSSEDIFPGPSSKPQKNNEDLKRFLEYFVIFYLYLP